MRARTLFTASGIALALSASVLSRSVQAQAEMQRVDVQVAPRFFFDAISYASEVENKSRVDVYVQVPYDEVSFVKEGDQFVARYEVILGVLTPTQQLLHERVWSVEVRANEFAQTTSNRLYSLSQRALDVDPGTYHLHVQVRDLESRRTAQVRKSLIVTGFQEHVLSLSDIMLVSRISTDGERTSIVPNISNNVAHLSDGFFLFFEVYSKATIDSLELTWVVLNAKKEEVARRSQIERLTGPKTQSFMKVDNVTLPMGNYFMTVDAVPLDTGKPKIKGLRATTSRSFFVRSADLPAAVTDLDKAVDQLIYIARDSELRYIREAADEIERRRRFIEFWAKRDPDPSTPRNELMEEYYQRVAYANANFSHYLEGWRTDMGMVYIRFGPPENIERHPFDYNSKPYEVWYYYQLNRQFIFVDETGFGDYRLRYPTTDLWGRIR